MVDETDKPPAAEGEPSAGTTLATRGFSVFEVYAHKAESLPAAFHFLIVFGVIFVLALAFGMLGEPLTIAIIAVTVLAAYLVLLFVVTRSEARRRASLVVRDEKLARFLGVPKEGGLVGIFVPIHDAEHRPEGSEPYHVRSVPLAHVQAVVELVSLLAQLSSSPDSGAFEPGNLFVDETAVDSFRGSTLILVGGPLPNLFVARMVEENPYLELEDRVDQIRLRCQGLPGDGFAIRPARADRTIRDVERETTYGVVQKLAREGRTTFAIWGLDERGTRGAARWLATSWRQADDELADRDFTAIVRFPPGRTYAPDRLVHHPHPGCPVLVPAIDLQET